MNARSIPCQIVSRIKIEEDNYIIPANRTLSDFVKVYQGFTQRFQEYHTDRGVSIYDFCLIFDSEQNNPALVTNDCIAYIALPMPKEPMINHFACLISGIRFDLTTLEQIPNDSIMPSVPLSEFLVTIKAFNEKYKVATTELLKVKERVNLLAGCFLTGTAGLTTSQAMNTTLGYPRGLKTTRGTFFSPDMDDSQLINEIARDWFANKFKYPSPI